MLRYGLCYGSYFAKMYIKTVTVKKIVDTVVKHYYVYYPFNCNTL